ncbi:MAG: prohibitin family protein [Alphaproteobacteria bacterium]|nr:prohibitin family protein [Alphaproteobacteria bacterium]
MWTGNIISRLALGLFAALLVLIASGSWFTVDQGERGVVLRNGAFVRVAEPGLGFKIPLLETVIDISIRTHKRVYKNLASYSKDIQLATLQIAVNSRVDASRVREVYERFGSDYDARILDPAVQGESKIVFGKFNAKEAIESRSRLALETEKAIREAVKDTGLLIDSIQIENIDFSKEFERSIEARMQAEVEVAKLQQNLEREKVQADIARTQARGRADALRAEAQARADATKLQGDAEAAAIRARADALKQNVNLVELIKAEKWNGVLPTTMLPGSATPFINIK